MSDLGFYRTEFPFREWLLLPERLMIHLPTSTALVSDLHLAFDLARNLRGDSSPSDETNLETIQIGRAHV